MKDPHFHLSIEHLVLGAIGVFAVAHVARIVGGMMAKGPSPVAAVGTALGGFFTVGGAH